MKRVAFKTLGCRLNQAETASMAASFVSGGYILTEFEAPCDVCVIHTCAITGRAERKCLAVARAARRRNPSACIVLAGCAAELGGPALGRRWGADLVVGQRDKFRIPELLQAGAGAGAPAPTPVFDTTRALVKMQDGCDFRCAYCIVPAARGGPVSRPLGLVLGELRALAAAGYREVTLTGANLGLYHDGRHGLADALRAAAAVEGIARIRLSSIEITTAEREVIACMAESPSFCRFLHLPLQTGDDRLLRAMGRRYTAAEYRDRLEHALDRLPRLGLGTDVIVGLPGEDDRAFDNTLRLLADYPFSNVHVFPYSPRPGTRAAAMPGQVPPALRRERARRVAELALEKRRAFAGSWVGATVAVLVEEVSADGEGTGWTSERIEARVRGKDLAANRIVTAPAAACAGDVLFIDG